jgi:hypothetical protein
MTVFTCVVLQPSGSIRLVGRSLYIHRESEQEAQLQTFLSDLAHRIYRPARFHLQNLEKVMTKPPATQALAEDVDWETQEGNEDGSATEDEHDFYRFPHVSIVLVDKNDLY